MKDNYIVEEPLFTQAEDNINTCLTLFSNILTLIDDVAKCPNDFPWKDYVDFACSDITSVKNYIGDFYDAITIARNNLALLDDAFVRDEKTYREKNFWDYMQDCGARISEGFYSLFHGDGANNLLQALFETEATLFVSGTAYLNKKINNITQPFFIVSNKALKVTSKLFSIENNPVFDISFDKILRGETKADFLNKIYQTRFGQIMNYYSLLKYDSTFTKKISKTRLSKMMAELDEKSYKSNYNMAKNALNTSAKDMKSFDVLFNDHYGGAQGDPSDILGSYGSERRLLNDNSIKGQKARMLYGKIKEYYPDVTLEGAKQIAEAYNQCGCSYMAVADAFSLHASSQKNGDKIFEKVVGKKLYSTDGNKKSANIEVLALDLFLYNNQNKSVDEIIRSESSNNASSSDYTSVEYLQNYFKEKNVVVYSISDDMINYNEKKMQRNVSDIATFEKNHDDAVYILNGWNYDMVAKNTDNVNNSGDGALTNVSSNDYLNNISGHAMFITGCDDNSIEVSSWAGKYDVPIASSLSNKERDNDKGLSPRLQVVGYDFDYSNVLK